LRFRHEPAPPVRHGRCLVTSAPRYGRRLLEAIPELDDRRSPIAETWRRLGALADELGVARPSYGHVRRLVQEHRAREDEARERREALRAIAADVANDVIAGRFVDPYDVADRVAKVDRV
jgi:hypothetical protein